MLKLRKIALDTDPENMAILAKTCSVYQAEEFRALKKIEITHQNKSILATLMIAEDPSLVADDELALGEQAFRRFGLEEGTLVTIAQATPPQSLESIRAKIRGQTLSDADFATIIEDIAAHRYSPMEITAFLISSASFLTTEEILGLTKAMANVGNRLHWDHPIVADKHCIGGVPGNRTSMIVVPIVAAHGLPIPKTSSRAITSPAGTADTMEVLANVDLSVDKLRDTVNKTNGCLAWGGHVNLSPADDILISVERPLSIDTKEQMVASILSKKLAAGATHLIIDIPVGPTAKVRSHSEAIRLRKLFEFVGDQTGLNLEVVVTDGFEPIGNGIGPILEARDVMAVLRNEESAPNDLRDRALLLAGRLIDVDPTLRGGSGYKIASDILTSGRALSAMEALIDAQGRQTQSYTLGPLVHHVTASTAGTVSMIDCYRLARIARLAGAPLNKGSGIDLAQKTGAEVQRGDLLYTIYSGVDSDFAFARTMAQEDSGYVIDGQKQKSDC